MSSILPSSAQTPGWRSLGQPQALQRLEPADPQRALRRVALVAGGDDEDAVLGAGDQRAIERGQPLLADFVEQLLHPLELAFRTKLEGDQRLGAGAHAMADVVAGHDEVLAPCRPGRE